MVDANRRYGLGVGKVTELTEDRQVKQLRPPWRVLVLIVALGVGAVFAVFTVPANQLIADNITIPVERQERESVVRRNLIAALGSIAIGSTAVVGWWRIRILNDQAESTRRQLDLLERGEVTDRFIRSVEQLGHAQPSVRMGGVYALERVASDSPKADAPTVTKLLTSFILSVESPLSQTRERLPVDVAAALHLLLRQKSPSLRSIDLSYRELEDFDFAGADLVNANLMYSSVRGVNFAETDLCGADLSFALVGGARLVDAVIDDRTRFHDAKGVPADCTIKGTSVNLISTFEILPLSEDLTGLMSGNVAPLGREVPPSD